MSKQKNKPEMLDKDTMGEMTRSNVDRHHNTDKLVESVLWKEGTIRSWDEAYENYVSWYKVYYSKLGRSLR